MTKGDKGGWGVVENKTQKDKKGEGGRRGGGGGNADLTYTTKA